MGIIRLIIRVLLIILGLMVFIPFGLITVYTWKRAHQWFFQRYCRYVTWLFGVQVTASGAVPEKPLHGTFYISNHVSYLDIPIYGAYQQIRFTPKLEIKSWPLFGFLTNLTNPVYIERRPSKSVEQKQMIRDELAKGDNILLFAEGTTSDGRSVLPFKSSLFSVLEPEEGKASAPVQLMALTYARVHGPVKEGEPEQDLVAWYGDAAMIPHMARLLTCKRIEVVLHYFPLMTLDDFDSRKEMASHCEELVRASVMEQLALAKNNRTD